MPIKRRFLKLSAKKLNNFILWSKQKRPFANFICKAGVDLATTATMSIKEVHF
jgi:hypothetical protein